MRADETFRTATTPSVHRNTKPPIRLVALLGILLLVLISDVYGQTKSTNGVALVATNGTVEVSRAGASVWKTASTAYPEQFLATGDALRTGQRSRAAVRLSDLTIKQIGANSALRVLAPRQARASISLLHGVFSFFHRDDPTEVEIETPTVAMAIRGTEFHVAVDARDGTTTVQLFDGSVDLSNAAGSLRLEGRSAGVAAPGQAPQRTAVLAVNDVLQWALYYPGVLDLDDLAFTPAESTVLLGSLQAYRAGDLLRALALYPAGRRPASSQERVYLSGLLLAVGEVDESARELRGLETDFPQEDPHHRLAAALLRLVDLVKLQFKPMAGKAETATELLVESYFQQAQARSGQANDAHLEGALASARAAAERSAGHGFAWARVAELEFSFGRIPATLLAVNRALEVSPSNAQALALKGFILSAQNQYRAAVGWFEQAMAVDEHLGNAWLGRGLCRIRMGDLAAGREDLEVAVGLEPHRGLLRSYLGKAWSRTRDDGRASLELERAKALDANDPTPWLYSALLYEQQNRLNEAVGELEHSEAINDNRRLYRSRLLLDQDRAVRGANLARIYQDAGLPEVGFREASRAVGADYGNYSAHLFLAQSYEALRDFRQINLRYETAALSEYTLGNLLAPVGAGTLSPYITQSEYGKFFEGDGLGLASSTDYSSEGSWWQTAVLHGTFGSSSFAVDTAYRSENGHRPNNDLWQSTTSIRLKQELTPRDRIYLQAGDYEAEAGDVAQYFDQSEANLGLRTKESQEPFMVLGYVHEWSPEHHTMLLGRTVHDTYSVRDPEQSTAIVQKDANLQVVDALPITIQQSYRSELTLYTVEAQHLWQHDAHTLVAGSRFQAGTFDTVNNEDNPSALGLFFPPETPPISQAERTEMQRVSFYAYENYQVCDSLTAIGGVSYDRLKYPENYRHGPISAGERQVDCVSPKAALIWTPVPGTTVRGAYTRSLGGVSLDQSEQLEPAQLAGFTQSYRSLIPESVAGAQSASRFETAGLAFDQACASRTYLGLAGEWLHSKVDREVGVFDLVNVNPPVINSGTFERLAFEEATFQASVQQLLGDCFSVGAVYRLSHAQLDSLYPEIPPGLPSGFISQTRQSATLHHLRLLAQFHHRSGFFGRAEGLWLDQERRAGMGDEFWQWNVYAGYRFLRRHGELRLGLLNLTGQDYRLDPLNLMTELPRQRTFVASFRFYF